MVFSLDDKPISKSLDLTLLPNITLLSKDWAKPIEKWTKRYNDNKNSLKGVS